MTEREQFEAWMRKREGYPYAGQYANLTWAAWQASRRAALEEAAKVCDGIAVDRWNLYKGRAPYTGAEEGRAQSHVQGESDGAESCAAAIRALSHAKEE